MTKFTIVLCVLLSTYGVQAGILTTIVGLGESNIVGLANQLSNIQAQLENEAGVSLDDFISSVSTLTAEYEEEMTEAMSETANSNVCSEQITKLREARNSTVNNAVKQIQSMIETAKSDYFIAKGLFDIIMIAMDNAETKAMECISNLFASFRCFEGVRTTFVETIASNLVTLTTKVMELTANQAVLMANIATTQVNAVANLNSLSNSMYQVLQECAVDSSNTTQ